MKAFWHERNSSRILPTVLIVVLAAPTSAQNFTKAAVQAPSDWHNVQLLTAGTRIRVVTDKKKNCLVDSVTEASLTCAERHGTKTYTREEIKEISMERKFRGRSAAAGAAIGAGSGAAAGALIGLAVNHSDTGSILHVSGEKASGVGAAIGAPIAGIAGALIGYSTDWLAKRTVVYRHP